MTTTPDYNNGEWHVWSGGECPVHPKTLIEKRTVSGFHDADRRAETTQWSGKYNPFLFRVTKQHIEPPKPLELWVNVHANGWCGRPHETEDEAVRSSSSDWRTVHMRRVSMTLSPTAYTIAFFIIGTVYLLTA